MNAKKPSLLPVILLAVLAGGLTLFFLASLRTNTPVVVAKRPISVGARLTQDDLEIKQVRSADALPNALGKIEDGVGQVVSLQRAPGDQITADMLGSQAVSAIGAGLAPDHRAVAVKVTRSSGLAGLLRPGDYVSLIAVVEPPQNQTYNAPELSALAGGTPITPTATPAASATPAPELIVPQTSFARVTATGLKVLLVPQTFRYEEVTSTEGDGFAKAQSSQVGQNESVIVLDVPVAPVTLSGVDGPLTISLPELIALLDTHAKVYLALEPSGGAQAGVFPGVAIEQIVDQGVGGK